MQDVPGVFGDGGRAERWERGYFSGVGFGEGLFDDVQHGWDVLSFGYGEAGIY